jgi:hypothetical protein
LRTRLEGPDCFVKYRVDRLRVNLARTVFLAVCSVRVKIVESAMSRAACPYRSTNSQGNLAVPLQIDPEVAR